MWTIQSWYREAREAAEAKPEFVRKMAELWLNNYERGLTGVSRAEIVRRLQQCNRERLDAVPSLTKYPELRGMRELVEASWRGARDGAKLDDAQWAGHCDGGFYFHRFVSTGKAMPIHCSYIFFPTSDRGPLLANNLDSSPAEPFNPPAWPAISEHLLLGTVSSGVFLDEESPEIFPAPVFKLIARYCRTSEEAVEMLTRYNLFWGPCNALVVDRNKKAAMIEKSACRIGVRWSPDGFAFITAMTAQEPGMQTFLQDRRTASILARKLPKENADAAYWKAQDKRGRLMNELLDDARRNPTVETMRRFIQFRDPQRGNVCGNGEIYFPGGQPSEYTLKTSLWLLGEGRAMWWAREGDKPSFENRKPDVTFENVWLWE